MADYRDGRRADRKKSPFRNRPRADQTNSRMAMREVAPQDSVVEDDVLPKRIPSKGKTWTVHVTWDVLSEETIQYTLRKQAIIISPMSHETPYAMQFLRIGHKDSKLDKRFFAPIMKLYPPNTMYTGQWETAVSSFKLPGVVFNTSMVDSRTKRRICDALKKQLGIDVPSDDIVHRQVVYGSLVATFLMHVYDRLKGDTLKVVFHGVETALGYLLMDFTRYYDYMQMVYLIHQPVLGGFKPKSPDAAVRKASQLGLRWHYQVEYAVLETIDHLLTTMEPSMSYFVLKRQYRRVPDLFFDKNGKNDVLPVQLRPQPSSAHRRDMSHGKSSKRREK